MRLPDSVRATSVAAIALGLAACGGGSGGSGGSGTLSLALTDAPVDGATSVVVQFSGVEIQPASGNRHDFDFATPHQIDLMDLQDGVSVTLLDGVTLPSGQYNWIRLKVDAAPNVRDSYIVVNGSEYELEIPSGAQTGLKLNRGFVVPAGGEADFTVDFDLRKSVHQPQSGPDYKLRPTLRIVDNTVVGGIRGQVDATLLADAACTNDGVSAVYVFAGAGVTPDDVDGTDPDPVTTATVKLDPNTSHYVYRVAFLEPGDYTVAFTCQASLDEPDRDDAIVFGDAATVTVTEGAFSTHDFVVPVI